MKVLIKRISSMFAALLVVLSLGFNVQAADKIRIALGDVASVETLCFLVALDRAKDRGLDYEMTAFAKEAARYSGGNRRSDGYRCRYSLLNHPEEQSSNQELFSAE